MKRETPQATKCLRRNAYFSCFALLCASTLSGCTGDISPAGNYTGQDIRPIADAGSDQQAAPSSWVRLDGSDSYDPQGKELSYLWSQVGGPDVELQSWRTPIASFSAPATELAEPLVFRLEVDNGETSAEATSQVRVLQGGPPPPPEDELRADAGADLGVRSGDWVVLDGSASSAPGEEALEYLWSQISGVEVEIADDDQAVAGFQALEVSEGLETLVFELVVTQGADSDSDQVHVIVVAQGGPGPDPACSDGVDNDDDGLIDYPDDPGCQSNSDDDELDAPPVECTDHEACDDGDPCTMDACLEHACQHTPDPECEQPECTEDGHCEDGNLCTIDICNAEGVCKYELHPDCECLENSECDDSDPCTVDVCTAEGLCRYEPDPDCETQDRPLLLTSLDDEQEVVARYGEWGVQASETFSGWCIQSDDDWHWSEQERSERTDYCLENQVPDPDYAGFICLDWEGEPLSILKEGSGHPLHAQILAEYIRLLRYIQAQRPHAKVGYYSMPVREYWDQGDAWRQAMFDARELFEESTALFPSVYDFYACGDDPEDDNYQCRQDHERYGVYVRFALELAEGKPVMLYTYHRYHLANDTLGFYTIPADEHIEHARALLSVEYNGRRPAGVVAWGATQYYYNQAFETDEHGNYTNNAWAHRRMREVFTEEMLPGESLDDYVSRLHPQVYSNLAEAIRSVE